MTARIVGRASFVLARRTRVPNHWSLQEVRRLRELAEAGMSLEAIAATLRRTRSAIKNKAGFHAIPLRSGETMRGR